MALDRDRFEQNRVDGYLDALGRGERPEAVEASDDALNALLLEWREDLSAAPLPAGPSAAEIDSALSASTEPEVSSLDAARERKRARRNRSSRNAIAVGAAAVLAVAIGSLSVMAYSAQPGDPLWRINKTMFSHNATDIELVASLQRDLDAAHDALSRGDTHTAAELVQSVSERLDGVQSAADRVNLIRLRDQIERDISRGQAGAETDLPARPPAPAPTAVPTSQPDPSPAPRPMPPVPTTSAQPLPTIAPAPMPTSQLPPPPQITPAPTLPSATVAPQPTQPPVSPLDPSILELRSVPTSQATSQDTRDSSPESRDTSTGGNSAPDMRLGK